MGPGAPGGEVRAGGVRDGAAADGAAGKGAVRPSWPARCAHGGAFFDAIGAQFDRLERADGVISADVLDAWFDPPPALVAELRERLPFLLRTSPPTDMGGLVAVIARERGLPGACVLPGAGSSQLLFLALREWVAPGARVLLPDPCYGEYEHLLGRVVGAQVERLALSRANGFRLDAGTLAAAVATGPELVVLVNPASPAGTYLPRGELQPVLAAAPPRTLFWIDETYLEYADPGGSLEAFAASHPNVVVCKSLSKAYALSGLRVAYLVAHAGRIDSLAALNPPWAVSLPGQLAAVRALSERDWYPARWAETRTLREALGAGLSRLGLACLPSTTNFLLARLPPGGPEAPAVLAACRERGLFLRDARGMGRVLDARDLRVAVKDAATNARLLGILGEVLGALAPGVARA